MLTRRFGSPFTQPGGVWLEFVEWGVAEPFALEGSCEDRIAVRTNCSI